MNAPIQLSCPKCQGAMASYERSGIVVDQCRECRGIFLDRGELERLLDLEGGAVEPSATPTWSGPPPQRDWRSQQPQSREWSSRHDRDDHSDHRHRGGSGGSSSHGGHKKKSLLREFLDFD